SADASPLPPVASLASAGNARGFLRCATARGIVTGMTEVTQILSAIEHGDPSAAGKLLPLVYDELRQLAARKLAHERPGQPLDPPAWAREAFLRLVDTDEAQRWDSGGHFFAACAEAMRRILVENARRKMRHKHGGGRQRVDLDVNEPAEDAGHRELLAL